MITRQRETEKIFNFTRYSSVNLVWTYFFFFLKKEKEDLILLIRLMKREMRTVKISRLEESIIIEHDWTRKISIFVYLSLEFL